MHVVDLLRLLPIVNILDILKLNILQLATDLYWYIGKHINRIKDTDLGNICREVTNELERVKSDKLPGVQKFVRDKIGESAKERRDKSAEIEVSPVEMI